MRVVALFAVLSLLSACSTAALTQATTLAADTCTVFQGAQAADPALCTHNKQACAIGQAACAATPGVLAGLVPLSVPAAPATPAAP